MEHILVFIDAKENIGKLCDAKQLKCASQD